MRIYIYITLVVLAMAMLVPTANAQEGRRKEGKEKLMSREQFEKRKTEYIIKEIQLTKEEAKKFIPLMNRASKERREVFEKIRNLSDRENNGEFKTEAEYKDLVKTMTELMLRDKDLELQYLDSFLQIVPAKKYYKYKKCEFRFINKMMRAHGRHGRKHPGDKDHRKKNEKKDGKGPSFPMPF